MKPANAHEGNEWMANILKGFTNFIFYSTRSLSEKTQKLIIAFIFNSLWLMFSNLLLFFEDNKLSFP